MKGKLLILVFLLFVKIPVAQIQMKLVGEIPDYKGETFLLLRGDNGGVFVVDSSIVNSNGILEYTWDGAPDIYRIANDKSKLDFKINKENFRFKLKGKIEDGDIEFAENDENYEYQYYLSEFSILNESILEQREYLLTANPSDDNYKTSYNEFKRLKKEKRNLLKDLWGTHIDSWSARLALAQQELIPDIKLQGEKADEYYHKHFFKYFAFSDSLLIGTPVYYEKIGRYLNFHKMDTLIANDNFKKIGEVIGNLFWLTELDPPSQIYLTNYLVNRYPEEQYEKIYELVIANYRILNTCEYVLSSRTIRNRLNVSKSIKKGWQVPDVNFYHSTDGRVQSLSEVNSEVTLIVVWSGSCKHSVDMLTQLSDLYYTYKDLGLEIVAISLDHNLNYWRQAISYNGYPWINACDTGGLTGTTAEQLSIYATPSMFLIDPNLKTVAIPQTYFQLERQLDEVFR